MTLIEIFRLSRKKRKHRQLLLTFITNQFKARGKNMTFTMAANEDVTVSVAPDNTNSSGHSSTILSNVVFATSDATIFNVQQPVASNPLVGAVLGVAAGTATLTITATATEADGTVHSIEGTATIVLTAVHASSLVLTFGTPFVPSTGA